MTTMLKLRATAAALLLCITLPACKKDSGSGGDADGKSGGGSAGNAQKSPHEQAVDDIVSLMEEFSESVGSAEDPTSARLAAEKLPKIGERFGSVAQKIKAMGKPDAATQEKLRAAYDAGEDALQERTQSFMQATSANPEVAAVLGKAVASFFQQTEESQGIVDSWLGRESGPAE